MAHLYFLGSGGWLPTPQRETPAALIIRDRHGLIIDAGSGLRRLLGRHNTLLDEVDEVDLILTHYHLDHALGLGAVLALPKVRRIWGGGERIGTTTTEQRILGPLRRRTWPSLNLGPNIGDLAEQANIGPWQVQSRIQNTHTIPSLALRFDDALSWHTDTAFDEENTIFAAGVSCLAHEAYCPESAARRIPGHSSGSDAGEVACLAGAGKLLLIHLPPLRDLDDELRREAENAYSTGPVIVAHDLDTIEL